MSDQADEAILREMLALADKLCRGSDALLSGQYRHLRSRIDALLELGGAVDERS